MVFLFCLDSFLKTLVCVCPFVQGHYSISKSAAWLGLGMDNVVAVPSDARGRMLPGALKEAVAAARARGATPFFVNATAGTTVLGAYDPLMELADVCQQEGLWLHVDVSVIQGSVFTQHFPYNHHLVSYYSRSPLITHFIPCWHSPTNPRSQQINSPHFHSQNWSNIECIHANNFINVFV